MREDLAAVNVTRTYTLAASNIAIFTFMLFFLYPRLESGRINPLSFQVTLIAMGQPVEEFRDKNLILFSYNRPVDDNRSTAKILAKEVRDGETEQSRNSSCSNAAFYAPFIGYSESTGNRACDHKQNP